MVPAMLLVWAKAAAGSSARHHARMRNRANTFMPTLLLSV